MDKHAAKDMRTPLARVAHLGSAKTGTHEFWMQRLTALALIPLTLLVLALVVRLTGADYDTAHHYLGKPVVSIVLMLLVLAGISHMRIGMKIIIEDYLHTPLLKTLSLIGNTFFSFAVGLACIYAALRIGFGS